MTNVEFSSSEFQTAIYSKVTVVSHLIKQMLVYFSRQDGPPKAAQSEPSGASRCNVPSAGWLQENRVTTARLLTLFRRCPIWGVEAAEEGHLILNIDRRIRVSTWVDSSHGLINFAASFDTASGSGRQELLELCNRINDSAVFVRFSVNRKNEVCCDYAIPYVDGISEAVIFTCVKRLAQVCQHALRFQDDEFLVKRHIMTR